MTDVIVDTNVAVIANRQNSDVVSDCVDACIKFLISARNDHVILIDSGDEIRAEYAQALKMSRPFALGAQFLVHIYQNQSNPKYVRQVDLLKTDDGSFVDFPQSPELSKFDLSDRKFAALAKNTGTPVTNATDSDWVDSLAALTKNDIQVNFLCGRDKGQWFSA